MNTAHPASLPPGPRPSGGIRRSTTASTTDASSDVKNIHGPGRTGTGGAPAPGTQGKPWLIVSARPIVVVASKKAALVARSDRRDKPGEDGAFIGDISSPITRHG